MTGTRQARAPQTFGRTYRRPRADRGTKVENLTIGNLKEKVAALEPHVERKWQPMEVESRARIAELEPRLASAEAALAQWLKIIPWSGFFPNPSRSHFEKYPEAKV